MDFNIGNANPIAVDGKGVIYTGSVWNSIPYLYAIQPTGTFKWRYEITGGDTTSFAINPAVSKNGIVYFLAGDQYQYPNPRIAKLYAVNATDGRLKWKYQINDNCQNNGPAIDANGNIYFGSDDGTIYSLSSSGSLRWNLIPQANDPFWGSSPAIGANGRIYIRSWLGFLYAIGQ